MKRMIDDHTDSIISKYNNSSCDKKTITEIIDSTVEVMLRAFIKS